MQQRNLHLLGLAPLLQAAVAQHDRGAHLCCAKGRVITAGQGGWQRFTVASMWGLSLARQQPQSDHRARLTRHNVT
jgi:hypothetical protein